jgi:hypothetical protein
VENNEAASSSMNFLLVIAEVANVFASRTRKAQLSWSYGWALNCFWCSATMKLAG